MWIPESRMTFWLPVLLIPGRHGIEIGFREGYLSSAFEPYVKDCLARQQVDQSIFFPILASQGGQEEARA